MTVKDPTIIVEIDGNTIIAVGTPESFIIKSTKPEYASAAKANTLKTLEVPLIHGMPYLTFPTGKATLAQITASMVAVNPGQAIIIDAPEEVMSLLMEARGEIQPGVIY